MTSDAGGSGPSEAAAERYATERVEAAFSGSQLPTMITRQSDGTIRFVNQACVDMLGWQESELVGRTVIEVGVYGPERRAEVLERMRHDGGLRDLEVEVTTKLGDTRLTLGSILRLELDGEACLVSQFHDMTEHRGLQARLRESEERLRQIADTLQQAFVLSTLEPPRVLYASPATERIFGIDRKTIYEGGPMALRSLIHPDDREHVAAQRDVIAAAADVEFRIVRPDGETRWLRARIEPVKSERGEAARWVSMAEDVTEERELREALRDSEERFRRLAENSTDVISRASPDAVLRYVSPACRRLYGYEPEELIGRPGWEFIHPEDLPALRDEVASRGARPDEVTNVYRVRRKDGSYVWMEAKSHTVRDPASGEVIELHTTARDVGEQRRAASALRRAKREAEEANSAKSEFLSRVSHELRTPLHAILGFGELLEDENLRPEQLDAVEQITKGGRHLLFLIDEVLDISAIERGDLKLSLEPVDVGEVISESLAMVAPLATTRSVTLRSPDAGDLAFHVLADRQRLKQALLNLVWNAVKYNREGGDVRVLAARAPARRPPGSRWSTPASGSRPVRWHASSRRSSALEPRRPTSREPGWGWP